MKSHLAVAHGYLSRSKTANSSIQPYLPTSAQIKEGFKLANLLRNREKNAVFMLQLMPHWIGDNAMWFRFDRPQGTEYREIDLRTGMFHPLFDESKLIDALVQVGQTRYEKGRIPIQHLAVKDEGKSLFIEIGGKYFQFDQSTGTAIQVQKEPDFREGDQVQTTQTFEPQPDDGTGSTPPVNQIQSRIQDGNIQLKTESGAWLNVTTGGGFDSVVDGKDGRHLLAWKCIPGDRKPLYLLHATGPNKTRATLETRLYDQPGDKLDTYIPFIIDAQEMDSKQVETEPMMGGAYPWPGAPSARWWNHGFLLDYPVRGYQEYKVDFINPQSGAAQNLIDEKSKTFVDLGKITLLAIPGTSDLLWNSERDGWARLYRINGTTGQVENAVTPPGGVFRKVEWIDQRKGQIYFTGNDYPDCIAKGQNPYLLHLYRANLDGSDSVDLTPENGTHTISFSPNHEYFVDSYSTVDTAPDHNLVQASSGKVVAHLAKADISRLVTNGVKLPIPFVAKGRDNQTDIWGVVCLPTNFNPKLKYPVIENIYAGPHDSFVPTQFYPILRMSELAELGFVVVQIDGMGTDNRSRAFHDVCWHNLIDAGFPDRILWMKALAKAMPQVDLSRVGVYGTSAGGQDTVNALLTHPEFYKVGVASCGCYDNQIDKQWWNEQWMGYPVGPWYQEQSCATNADKLQGHLMLMDAEDDHNVPPESSIRLADALIKAGKDFGYMIFPGSDHTDGGEFGERVRRNFFVQWLLGVNPPNWNEVGSKSSK